MTDHIDTAKEREKLAGLAGHTPGPWRKHSNGKQIVSTDTIIASSVWGAVKANTRLIAAAPDLLALAHSLLDALDAKDAEIEIMAAANAAAVARSRDDLTASFLCGRAEGREEIRRLLDTLDTERERAEKAEAERDEWKDEYQAVRLLLHRYKDAATNRQAERDQALARLAAVQAEMREKCVRVVDNYTGTGFLADQIRALTPADAETALQRMVDGTWDDAIEATARQQETAYRCGAQGEIHADIIRALKRPEASHE